MTGALLAALPRRGGPRLRRASTILLAVALGLLLLAAAWAKAGPERHGTVLFAFRDGHGLSRRASTTLPVVASAACLLLLARWTDRRRLRPWLPAGLLVGGAFAVSAALWWLNSAPGPEGRVIVILVNGHGLVERDIPALPVAAIGLGLFAAGLAVLARRLHATRSH